MVADCEHIQANNVLLDYAIDAALTRTPTTFSLSDALLAVAFARGRPLAGAQLPRGAGRGRARGAAGRPETASGCIGGSISPGERSWRRSATAET